MVWITALFICSGLITIEEHYKIVVSRKFGEGGDCSHSLRQFHRLEIKLPDDKTYNPDLEI